MSTLTPVETDRPITDRSELISWLAAGAHAADQLFIGAEMEALIVDTATGAAADFARIEALLLQLENIGPWRGQYENGHLVGLMGERSSITLEPGGQIELSGALCRDVHCSHRDYLSYLAQIAHRGRELGLTFLGLGTQPFSQRNEISWLPKDRYAIMAHIMEKTGRYGQDMMKRSAGLQVNLDFTDEADCMAKLRLAQQLAPLLYALFANSPLLDGQPTGYLSTRGLIWGDTDPTRCGLIPTLLADNASFATYVDYALQVPMYFIIRSGRYIDLTGQRFTFGQFLAEGYAGHRALPGDWSLHQSTLFTEVRLRPQIEIRSADSLPGPLTLSVSALLKGLFYDADARYEMGRLLAKQDLTEAYRLAPRLGLRTPCGSTTLQQIAIEALALARDGLRRQRRPDCSTDETAYLNGLDDIAESGVTLAERLLSRWHGSHTDKLAALYAHAALPA